MVLILAACKKTKEIIYDPTNVDLTVVDDNGNPLQGAVIRLFDDIDKYQNSKEGGAETGYVTKVISDKDGKAYFDDLNSEKSYYFLVTYRDRVRFLDLDNQDQNYAFDQLTRGTTSKIKIQLEPAKSVVSFYANNTISGQLPISLFIDEDSIGTITESVNGKPTTAFEKGTLSFRLSQGTKNWYAKSALGCIWTGQVQVKAIESFEPISLQDCNAGSVTFYTDEENKGILPVKITLGKNDQIGQMNSYLSTVPTGCFQKGTVTAARDVGTYTYTAESVRSGCVWTGTVTIAKGSCSTIKLSKCN